MTISEKAFTASYDALAIAAHPDDAESQIGGTLALLGDAQQRILLVDLTAGEPAKFAEPGVRAQQATAPTRILGALRLALPPDRTACSWTLSTCA